MVAAPLVAPAARAVHMAVVAACTWAQQVQVVVVAYRLVPQVWPALVECRPVALAWAQEQAPRERPALLLPTGRSTCHTSGKKPYLA